MKAVLLFGNIIIFLYSLDYTVLSFVIELIIILLPAFFIVQYLKDPEKKASTLIKIITAYSCALLFLILFNGVGAIVIQKNSVTTFPFNQTNNTQEQIVKIWSLTNSQSTLNCTQNLTINSLIICDLNNNTLRISDWITLILAIIGTIAAYILLLEIIREKSSFFSTLMDYDDAERNKMSCFVYAAIFFFVIAIIILIYGSNYLIKENWYQFPFLLIIIIQLMITLRSCFELKKKFTENNQYLKIEQFNRSYDKNEDNIKIYFRILEQLDFWTFIISGFAVGVIIFLHFSIIIFFILIVCFLFNHYFYSLILNIPYEKVTIFFKNNCANEDFSQVYILKKSKDSLRILRKNDEFVTVMKDTISHYVSEE